MKKLLTLISVLSAALFFGCGMEYQQLKAPQSINAAQVEIDGEHGGSLAIVHADGTVDVWLVPVNSSVQITGQRGFGDAFKASDSVSLIDAEAAINTELGNDGAKSPVPCDITDPCGPPPGQNQ